MRDKFLKIYGVLPFLAISFINSFLDLGHKIIIQNTIYKSYDGANLLFLTAIVNALILLPFIMLLSPSGYLADKYPKNKVMRISAWVSLVLVCFICLSYYLGAFWLAFWLTFAMGMQSAIYSPAKYGFIKELAKNELLARANGAINAISIVAILASMAIFSLSFEFFYTDNLLNKEDILSKIAPLGFILIAFAILELILAYRLPTLRQTKENLSFDTSAYIKGRLLKDNIKAIFENKIIWLCIVGISIFWAISQLYMVSFPTFAKTYLGVSNTFYVQNAIAFSGIGIIVGSLIAGRFSRNYIELGLIPLGALGAFISSFAVPFFDSLIYYYFIFFVFGLSGALFLIPLNALIQYHSKDDELGKILAGNNFIQNIFMFSFLLIATLWAYFKIDVVYIFYFICIITLLGSIYVLRKLPFSLVRVLLGFAFLQRYRLLVEGFSNIPTKGGALILGNHISFIDWAVIQMAIPRKVYFVMERNIYAKWYIKIFLDKFGVIPVSSTASKEAIELIAKHIKNGDLVCLFPEGTLSRHGHLNEFKRGFELVGKLLNEDDGVIIPFYIRGLWGSSFSRSDEDYNNRFKKLSKRNIAIAFGKAMSIKTNKEELKAKVFELSFIAWKSHCESMQTISRAWIETAKKNLDNIAVVDNDSYSYRKVLALSLLLSKYHKSTKQNIGIMLPASLASILCNLSILNAGKCVVNLNYTAGINALNQAIKNADIDTVYTSSKFIKTLEDRGLKISFNNANVIYLEDLMAKVLKNKGKILGYLVLVSLLPSFMLKMIFAKDNDNEKTAAILFSSGSEGNPKGIMLSHKNILSNVAQISDVLSAKSSDVVLSSLPPFHAFGLTVTTFMPLLEGLKLVSCADPTNALMVAKLIAKNEATIMCATSTFLGIYARNKKLESIMFDSLRFVVAGAEKLKPEIRELFENKFKKEILEGYGATETTPVASVNLPNKFDANYWVMHRATKVGSVGMPLPGTAIRVVDPNTYEPLGVNEDGLILIGGHQIMKGYLNDSERTNEVIKEIDGIRWYNTKDKGHLDEDGFLYIVDRYSRFAKIGGEMVSLGMVEEEIAKILPSTSKICAISLDDAKKGEQIALLISSDDYESDVSSIKSSQLIALYKPSKYYKIDEIPVLGSGKVDYTKAKNIAKEYLNEGK